jgi:hypothetical protein
MDRDSIQKLELNKIIQEYIFLTADYEYKKRVVDDYSSIFFKEANSLIDGQPDSPDSTNQVENKSTQTKKNIDVSQIDQSSLDKIKMLWREISKKTHPDKDISGKYSNYFLLASEAYQNYDLYALFKISLELGLSVELDPNDSSIIKGKISERKEEISKIENSYLWLWFKADGVNRKVILENFVKQVLLKK